MQLSGFIYRYGRWISWLAMGLSIAGVIYWGYSLTTPSKLRIATGKEGTYSFVFGRILKKQIEKRTDFDVVLRPTKGTTENQSLLLSGEVDLAILRPGFVSMENLAAVNPLWKNYVHLITRKSAKIDHINKLKRKSISLGNEGTKNREIATKILKHFSIKLEELDDTTAEFQRLSRDNSYVAAIAITSLHNPNFQDLIKTAQFDWLPLTGASGLAQHLPFFFADTIPESAFSTIKSPLPSRPKISLATTSILASRMDAPFELIQAVMPVLNTSALFKESVGLLGREWTETEQWYRLPVHPAANRFFKTYYGLEMLSGLVENFNRYKELVAFSTILLIAAFFEWKRRIRHNETKGHLEETRKLEAWLIEITHIELEQKKAKDLRLLKQYHQDALIIKEHALKEVVGKSLQDSNFFQTFLQECLHVIHEIELKISGYRN